MRGEFYPQRAHFRSYSSDCGKLDVRWVFYAVGVVFGISYGISGNVMMYFVSFLKFKFCDILCVE